MRGDTRGGTQAAREAGRMGGQPRWAERAVAGGKEPGRSRSERQRGWQWPAWRVAAGGGAASQNASSQRTLRGLLGAPPLPAHMHICDRVPSKCALDRLHPPTPYLVIALQPSADEPPTRLPPCLSVRSFPDLRSQFSGPEASSDRHDMRPRTSNYHSNAPGIAPARLRVVNKSPQCMILGRV